MRRIAVTGATGFLGTSLLDFWSSKDDVHIRALARTLQPDHGGGPRLEWMQGDLASPYDCARFIRGVEVIVHLAHVNTPLTSDAHLPSDAAANLVPTLTLLQAIKDAKSLPHVVLPSSGGAVYRVAGDQRPFRESDPCEPTSSYGIQKLAAEHYLRMGAEQGWLSATVLRIGNPYGVLLPPERRQGFIGVALNQLLHGKPIRIFGDPHNVRDYVHLDDMCRMFSIVSKPQGGFSVLNVGSGEGHSVEDLLGMIERIARRPVEVIYDPPSVAADRLPPWVVLDIENARARGWSPEIQLEAGLERLWADACAAT